MGAEKVGRRYRGKGATGYESKRAGKSKWIMENNGVETLLPVDANTVLDVPVGTGRFNYLYRQRGLNVTGVDTSHDMLEEARKKGMHDLRVGDIRHLHFDHKRFDVAVCIRLFAWFEPDEVLDALTEMARVAGILIVNIRTKEGEAFCKSNSLWNHSRADFTSWVATIGYQVDEVFHVGNKGNDIYRLTPCV
jgi:2-polyprenyl-3-methyl-5-hydroxy-6-metoxy-1,4-benzoquinol methylase